MNINDWTKTIHQNAVDHGWWEEARSLPEILMLCVSELAEALEEYRDGRPLVWFKQLVTPRYQPNGEDKTPNKPEGVAVELADCIIRILDYCGKENIDIEAIMLAKHEYNKSRPYRHGGKKC